MKNDYCLIIYIKINLVSVDTYITSICATAQVSTDRVNITIYLLQTNSQTFHENQYNNQLTFVEIL